MVRLKASQIACWQEASLVRRFWHLLDHKYSPFIRIRGQLQEVLVLSNDRVLLHMDASESAQDPDNSLACMAAGSVEVLSGLATAMPAMRAVYQSAKNYKEQSDAAMLRMMPVLQWLEIGDTPLHAPFHGTVQGFLSRKTAETFRQASAVHCTGLGEHAFHLQDLAHMECIQSWTSIPAEWRESAMIGRLAPQVEILLIQINTPCSTVENGCPVSVIELGPTMESVHVTFDYPDQPMLLVNGWPSKNLVHMHLACNTIRLKRDLFEYLQAKQAKPLVCAQHRIFYGENAEQTVFLQQLDPVDHLVMQFDSHLS